MSISRTILAALLLAASAPAATPLDLAAKS